MLGGGAPGEIGQRLDGAHAGSRELLRRVQLGAVGNGGDPGLGPFDVGGVAAFW